MRMKSFRLTRFFLMIAFITLFAACVITSPEKPPVPLPRPAKIAVVLGAGASKGFAHIGVLKVLESHRVPIHIVIGTSVGSFVGSLYAYGYTPYDMQTIALGIKKDDVADYTLPDNGFIKGEKLENYINQKVNHTTLEKLKIPFYVVATNIQTGEEMVFGRGNTGRAVRASCAIPGIFYPVVIAEKIYVDGGVVSPVAVDAARRFGADVVIAVNISSRIRTAAPAGTVESIMQAIDIMHNRMAAIQLRHADVVIQPSVGHIGASDFTRRHEAIMEGEKAATEAMPEINGILAKLREEGRLP